MSALTPSIACHAPLCFKCGEASHHAGLTCQAYAARLAASTSPRKEAVRWMLTNW